MTAVKPIFWKKKAVCAEFELYPKPNENSQIEVNKAINIKTLFNGTFGFLRKTRTPKVNETIDIMKCGNERRFMMKFSHAQF
jgi:hypothetical protein